MGLCRVTVGLCMTTGICVLFVLCLSAWVVFFRCRGALRSGHSQLSMSQQTTRVKKQWHDQSRREGRYKQQFD